jgi:hypothetical protein
VKVVYKVEFFKISVDKRGYCMPVIVFS